MLQNVEQRFEVGERVKIIPFQVYAGRPFLVGVFRRGMMHIERLDAYVERTGRVVKIIYDAPFINCHVKLDGGPLLRIDQNALEVLP